MRRSIFLLVAVVSLLVLFVSCASAPAPPVSEFEHQIIMITGIQRPGETLSQYRTRIRNELGLPNPFSRWTMAEYHRIMNAIDQEAMRRFHLANALRLEMMLHDD